MRAHEWTTGLPGSPLGDEHGSGARVRHDAGVDDDELRALGQRLCEVDGVVGVLLGGSRARGEHMQESDFDLGPYYEASGRRGESLMLLPPSCDRIAMGGWAVAAVGEKYGLHD